VWRNLHNEEFRCLYSPPDIISVIKSGRMRKVGHVARTTEMRNAYDIVVGKIEKKRSFGRPTST
jgi:hypothetical protein